MGLIEQAVKDLNKFSSNETSGFAVPGSFTAPNGVMATVGCISVKHHYSLNEEGKQVNAKVASFSVSESLLTALSYPVRNSSNEVYLEGHQVKIKDSSGLLCMYVIREWYPDEALGLITCKLGDFE